MIPAVLGLGILVGVLVGWWARGRYSPLPDCYALLCRDLGTAAMAWREGTRIVCLDGYGVRELTQSQVQRALADRLTFRGRGVNRA